MDDVSSSGLTQEAQVLSSITGTAALPWAPLLCCTPGAIPGTSLLLGQPAHQQQQPLFYNHSIPVFPSYTFAGHTPVLGVSAGHTAITAQQLQFNSGPVAVQPAGCILQAPQQPPQQDHQDQPGQASSEEDTHLCDLLADFEQQQSHRQGSLQQQPLDIRDLDGLEQNVDDTLDNPYQQQRIAEQLQQESGQQGIGLVHRQPAVAVASVAGMDAPYPYQTVYGNQPQIGSMAQQQYRHAPDRYPCHPGAAVPYNYGYLPLPPFPQYQPPPYHAPWANSWAAGVQKRHGEVPSGCRPMVSSRQSSGSSNPASEAGATTGQVQPPWFKPVFTSRQSSGSSNPLPGVGATADQEQHPGQRSTSHHSNTSKHKSKQQSKQPAGTATAAAAAASKPGSSTVSRNSPEQYFRRHVALVDPFVATATSDDVGLVAVTHLPPASSQASASGLVMNSSMDIALTISQMTMLRSRTATLQLVCLLVDDKVPHRCHWPCSAGLTVNGQIIRHLYAAKRTPSIQLKPHQIDAPADISTLATVKTAVSLSYVSNSSGYVLGARLVRQQSMDRVKQMLGKQPTLTAAVAEVKKKLAGDGDVEVSVNAVSLRCPLTAMRIKTPAHFTIAPGLAYFDLDSFLELTQRSGKWQDPHSSVLGNASQVAVEPWLASIIKQLETADLIDSVDEVEVNPDGRWRPKGTAGDTWFDVLRPPTAPQLREAFRGPSGAGIKRRRPSGNGDTATEQQVKQQRFAADAAGAKGKTGCVDLTLESDDEADAEPAAARQASAAVLLAKRFQASSGVAGPPSESAGCTSSGLGDSGFAAFCEDMLGADYAMSGRNHSSRSAGPVRTERGSAAGLDGSVVTRGMVTRRQAQNPGNGSQTPDAAAVLARLRIAPPAAPRQQQQQHSRAGMPAARVPAGAAAADADVIVIDDSDSE